MRRAPLPKMRTRRNEETKVTQARKAKAAPVWKSQIRKRKIW